MDEWESEPGVPACVAKYTELNPRANMSRSTPHVPISPIKCKYDTNSPPLYRYVSLDSCYSYTKLSLSLSISVCSIIRVQILVLSRAIACFTTDDIKKYKTASRASGKPYLINIKIVLL